MPRENDCRSDEFMDEFLHVQAYAGAHLLDQEGFHYRLTQDEMKKLAIEGRALLFIDFSNGK